MDGHCFNPFNFSDECFLILVTIAQVVILCGSLLSISHGGDYVRERLYYIAWSGGVS